MSDQKTYVIAEMACSHDGSPDLAKIIIEGAGLAGADAIQFQIWKAEQLVVPTHKDLSVLQKIEISEENWKTLAEYVKSKFPTMDLIACIYNEQMIALAEALGVDAYKLHTADLSNPNLIRRVAATGKRIDLSVGGSTLDEIVTALGWIDESGGPETWLMYGLQNFPTPPSDVRLKFLKKLQELLSIRVGYQDHTDAEDPGAYWIPAAAQGMGIDVLEKHITHNRSLKGADYQAALNPDEFHKFIKMVRELDDTLQSGNPQPLSPAEQHYRKYSKKSLVAKFNFDVGYILKEKDVLAMRTEEPGSPPDTIGKYLGKPLRRSLAAYETLRESHV